MLISYTREELLKMSIDDVRDIIGDDNYTMSTQRHARRIVDAFDYGTP